MLRPRSRAAAGRGKRRFGSAYRLDKASRASRGKRVKLSTGGKDIRRNCHEVREDQAALVPRQGLLFQGLFVSAAAIRGVDRLALGVEVEVFYSRDGMFPVVFVQ